MAITGTKLSQVQTKLEDIKGTERIYVSDNGTQKYIQTKQLAKPSDIPDVSGFITGLQADKKYATIDQVGDINSILEKNGMKYVSTNLISGMLEGKDVGGIINIDSPTPNGFIKHCIIDCVAGDMFLVQGKGATNARLWAFLDAANKIISVDNIPANDRFHKPLTIIAPDEASKLICNFNVIDYPSSGTAKYVNAIPDIVTDAKKVQTQQDSLEAKSRKYFADNLSYPKKIEELDSKQGIFNNGAYSNNSLFISKKYKIDKELLYSVTTTIQEGSSGYQLVTFFDAKDKYISSFYDAKEYASLTKECINIPFNADYFYLTGLNNRNVIAEELISSNYNLEEVGKISDSFLEKKNIEFVSGAYVTSSVEVGHVFDYRVSPNESVTCAKVSISKNDVITLTAKEVSIHARAYIFLDEDKKVLSCSPGNLGQITKQVLDIPENAVTLLCNNATNTISPELIVGSKVLPTVAEKINNLEQRVTKIEEGISPINNQKLKGKKVLMLGDSLTEFIDSLGKGIVEYFGEITGAETIRGAIGGSCLTKRLEFSAGSINSAGLAQAALDVVSIVNALVTGDFTAQEQAVEYLKLNNSDDNTEILNNLKSVNMNELDIITIFAATNDSKISSMSLGNQEDTETYRNISGAINTIVSLICSNYPNISVYFFTPVPRLYTRTNGEDGNPNGDWDTWSDVYAENESKILLPNFADKIEEMAKYNHIPCCNLYWTLGWNKYNYKKFVRNNSTDGTHPFNGFNYIAAKMASFIESNVTFDTGRR